MSVDELLADRLDKATDIRGPFPMPEWAPHVPEVWARKFTIARRQKVSRWIEEGDPEGWAQVVYRFALDAEGARLFHNPGQLRILLEAEDDYVIIRLAKWIMRLDAEVPSLDDLMGESKGIPNGGGATTSQPG